MNTTVSEGEFKGHNTITLEDKTEGVYPVKITMGVKKAQIILRHIADLEAFVAKNEVKEKVAPEKPVEF